MTNALTGIGEALLDSVPIVGIVTDVDRRPGPRAFQVHSTPNAAVLRPICKQSSMRSSTRRRSRR